MRDDGNFIRTKFRQRQILWRYAQTNDKEIYQDDPQLDAIRNAERLAEDDPRAALLQWCAMAERGSVWSMFRAGLAYRTGTGIAADQAQAEYWYRLASGRGCQQAQLRLGHIYEEGRAFDQCEEVYNVGVHVNWAPAMYQLAWAKLRQPETPERLSEARLLLEKAASHGDLGARLDLAALMARGRFGKRLRPRGFYLLFSAAKQVIALDDKNAAVSNRT